MRFKAVWMAVGILVLVGVDISHAQESVDGFVARTFTGKAGAMPYRLFIPDKPARARRLPLIIYLHGAGGAGNDNLKQISGGNAHGTRVWTTPAMQKRHAAYVLAPQIPSGRAWGAPNSDEPAPMAQVLLDLLAALRKEFAIDAERIYLMGQSLGGRGTWDLISKRPALFAAAIPVCGDGNPTRIKDARGVAIWAFHGAMDQVVPVAGSRDMVAALKTAGSGVVKYTEYPDVEHDAWVRAFAEHELPDWLFAQRRKAP